MTSGFKFNYSLHVDDVLKKLEPIFYLFRIRSNGKIWKGSTVKENIGIGVCDMEKWSFLIRFSWVAWLGPLHQPAPRDHPPTVARFARTFVYVIRKFGVANEEKYFMWVEMTFVVS
jgi:hypothetical protein